MRATHSEVGEVLEVLAPRYHNGIDTRRLKIVYRPRGWSSPSPNGRFTFFSAHRGRRKITLTFNVSPKHHTFRREFVRALTAAVELQQLMTNELVTTKPNAITVHSHSTCPA